MKGLLLFGVSLCLIFAPIPIQAQIQVTPSPSTNTVIENVTDLAQTLGAVGFVTVALAVVLVLLIVGVLLFFWKVVSPLLAAISADRQAREEAVTAERQAREEAQSTSSTQLKLSNERERDLQALRTRQAEAMETGAGIQKEILAQLNDPAPRFQSIVAEVERHQSIVQREIILGVNNYTHNIGEGVIKELDGLRRDLVGAVRALQDAAQTMEIVTENSQLVPIREELAHIGARLNEIKPVELLPVIDSLEQVGAASEVNKSVNGDSPASPETPSTETPPGG